MRDRRSRNPLTPGVVSVCDQGGGSRRARRGRQRERSDRARHRGRGDGLGRRRLGLRRRRRWPGCSAPSAVHASHVNYGLRAGADEGEAAARRLCAALRIDLHVERPQRLPDGNLQARRADRPLRRRRSRLRDRTGAAVIVTGHTRTDVAETALYRLAASPGSRALLGLRAALGPRRPAAARARARAGARAGDRRRAAVRRRRDQRRPDLRPQPDPRRGAAGAARRQPRRRAEHRRDPRRARRGGGAAGAGRARGARRGRRRRRRRRDPARPRSPTGSRACAGSPCARSPSAPPAARSPLGRGRAAEIERLAAQPEGGTVELGSRPASASASRARSASAPPPLDAAPAPGAGRARASRASCASASGRFAPSFIPGPVEPAGPDLATLDAEALAGAIEVRTWRHGDRIRPLGMSGTKTLQDLFTDRGVPRSQRGTRAGRHRRRRGRLGRRGRGLRALQAASAGGTGRGAHRALAPDDARTPGRGRARVRGVAAAIDCGRHVARVTSAPRVRRAR